MQQITALINSAGSFFISDEAGTLSVKHSLLSRQLAEMEPQAEEKALLSAREAIQDDCASYKLVNDDFSLYCLCAPLPSAKECLVTFLVTDRKSLSPFLMTLQLLAALLDEHLENLKLSKSCDPEKDRNLSANLLSALTQACMAEKNRFHHFNQALKSFLDADFSAVAISKRKSKTAKTGDALTWVAVSDVASVEHDTEQHQLLASVAMECIHRRQATCLPLHFKEEGNFAASLILEKLARHLGCLRLVALPLLAEGCEEAVLVAGWKESRPDQGHRAAKLLETGPLLASILFLLSNRTAGRERPESKAVTGVRRYLPLILVGFMFLLFLLPVPYRPKSDAVVRPHVTRFVVARYDGILLHSLVRPGDRVRKGQVLAHLDKRDLEVQLAGLQAELDKAQKQKDLATARGDIAAAQLARLEAMRINQQLLLLKRQREQLAITSPVDGIVLSGDLQRAEGSPVTRGQILFEVAHLDPMEVEVHIPAAIISEVAPSSEVRIRFEAYPQRSWQHSLDRIEPRAQIRNNSNIFLGLLKLDNPDGQLIPGMRGIARISLGYRPLGWILFRKPWYTLQQFFDSFR